MSRLSYDQYKLVDFRLLCSHCIKWTHNTQIIYVCVEHKRKERCYINMWDFIVPYSHVYSSQIMVASLSPQQRGFNSRPFISVWTVTVNKYLILIDSLVVETQVNVDYSNYIRKTFFVAGYFVLQFWYFPVVTIWSNFFGENVEFWQKIQWKTLFVITRVFRRDSPRTRSRRSEGSGGESSSMLTSVEGNAVQGRMLL
jgi:hypothetical protein